MAQRAAFLAAVFTPFLLLAPLLFLLSSLLLRCAGRCQSRLANMALVTGAPALPPTAAGSGGLPAVEDGACDAMAMPAAAAAAAAPAIKGSGVLSGRVFPGGAAGAPLSGAAEVPGAAAVALDGEAPGLRLGWAAEAAAGARRAAWRLLLVGVRAGGAAFIKWGQWSATREDMFPAVRAPAGVR